MSRVVLRPCVREVHDFAFLLTSMYIYKFGLSLTPKDPAPRFEPVRVEPSRRPRSVPAGPDARSAGRSRHLPGGLASEAALASHTSEQLDRSHRSELRTMNFSSVCWTKPCSFFRANGNHHLHCLSEKGIQDRGSAATRS